MTYPVLDPAGTAAPVPAPGACALAMMIKAPRPGMSKTRLSPPLTPEEAAGLSQCFLRDTTENIGAVVSEHAHPAAGIAVYTPVGMESAFDGLLPDGFCLVPQRGELFGDRLIFATEDLFSLGYGAVCLIDSDSPTLPASALTTAVETLAEPGERVVLGASEDGGYYLIGMKAPYRRLFEDIDWSTERVADQTRERAAEIGLEVVDLPVWYDVDDAVTLRSLCEELIGGADLDNEMKLAAMTSPDGTVLPLASPVPRASIGFAAPRTREFLQAIVDQEGRSRIWP